MAINPLIALQAQTPDLGQAIGSGLQNAGSLQTLVDNKQMAPARKQAAAADMDMNLIKSLAIGSKQLKYYLDNNDIGGAEKFLNERKAHAQALGLPTEHTDTALNDLKTDVNLLKKKTEDTINIGTQLGIFGKSDTGFSEANQLRSQFLSQTKDFAAQSDALGRVVASAEDPSAAGDMSLVFAYMKILDPGSTVREGEQATARNAAGVPDQIRNIYNRVMSGQQLGEDQRADFVDRSFRLYDSSKEGYDARVGSYSDIAARANLNPQDIIQAQPDIFGGKYQETRERLTKKKSKGKNVPPPDAPIDDLINHYNK